MSLDMSAGVIERVEAREHASEAHSIGRLLRPSSIAVIGAGSRPGTVGHEIVRSLTGGGFTGPVYPVSPKATAIDGATGYASVTDIPGPIDLAVVAIPSGAVPAVVEECAAKGVHGLVVVSGGFAEVGSDGAALQRQLVATARAHGMRVIGPNCVGVINTDPSISTATTGRPYDSSLSAADNAAAIAALCAGKEALGCVKPTTYSLGSSGEGNTSGGYYDTLGRRYYIGVKAKF
jgi:predicted CoA-binding protein